MLPIGLAEHVVMAQDVQRDTPITYGMVEFVEENLVIELRKSLQ